MIYWLTDNVIIIAKGASLQTPAINQVFSFLIFINKLKACYLYPDDLQDIYNGLQIRSQKAMIANRHQWRME